MDKKIVLQGPFEDIIELDKHFYIMNKKDRICVMPYTISGYGLLDKIGVIQDWNYVKDEKVLTLLNDYINEDDSTDLVAANRVLFEILGTNVEDANLWMYLGSLFNNMNSDSPIRIYAVNITNIEIKNDEQVQEQKDRKLFKLYDSSKVIQTDDMLFLSSFFRLFNYFYIKSLNQNQKKHE